MSPGTYVSASWRTLSSRKQRELSCWLIIQQRCCSGVKEGWGGSDVLILNQLLCFPFSVLFGILRRGGGSNKWTILFDMSLKANTVRSSLETKNKADTYKMNLKTKSYFHCGSGQRLQQNNVTLWGRCSGESKLEWKMCLFTNNRQQNIPDYFILGNWLWFVCSCQSHLSKPFLSSRLQQKCFCTVFSDCFYILYTENLQYISMPSPSEPWTPFHSWHCVSKQQLAENGQHSMLELA